jgi:hypothetical protein
LCLTAALQSFQRTINNLGEFTVTTWYAGADWKLETRFGERHNAQCGIAPRYISPGPLVPRMIFPFTARGAMVKK